MINYSNFHNLGYGNFKLETLIPIEEVDEFNKMSDGACSIPINGDNYEYVYCVHGKHNDPEWPFTLPLLGLEEN